MANFKNVAEHVTAVLNEKGIGCYIWHVATTGSAYIRFNDQRIGSIRIGDHDGRERLKYKFNLRADNVATGWRKDGQLWRYYCRLNDVKLLIGQIIDRAESVKTWGPAKFNYGIPQHKRK